MIPWQISVSPAAGDPQDADAICCFRGSVTFVRGKRIFARISEPGRQAIVYQMEFGAKQDLAMTRWDESDGLAKAFTKPEKSQQLIAPDAHVHYRSLAGKMKNEDIILGTA